MTGRSTAPLLFDGSLHRPLPLPLPSPAPPPAVARYGRAGTTPPLHCPPLPGSCRGHMTRQRMDEWGRTACRLARLACTQPGYIGTTAHNANKARRGRGRLGMEAEVPCSRAGRQPGTGDRQPDWVAGWLAETHLELPLLLTFAAMRRSRRSTTGSRVLEDHDRPLAVGVQAMQHVTRRRRVGPSHCSAAATRHYIPAHWQSQRFDPSHGTA